MHFNYSVKHILFFILLSVVFSVILHFIPLSFILYIPSPVKIGLATVLSYLFLSIPQYYQKLTVLFGFSYAVLFVLSNMLNLGFTAWTNNPMFELMPFVGFFFVFIALDYIDSYLEIKFANTVYFPLAFIIACFFSYWLVLYVYIGNTAQLSGQTAVVFDFWVRLNASAFLIFIFSGLLGWLSKIAMDKIGK